MAAAGICGVELDWSMNLADGTGNGRVRKPRIWAVKTLQNPSQVRNGLFLNVVGLILSCSIDCLTRLNCRKRLKSGRGKTCVPPATQLQ